jgi:hypothetical protein
MEDGGWQAQSALECGGPPPLYAQARSSACLQSARGLAHSKTWRIIVASLALFSIAFTAWAQSYSIDWSTIDGGGNTSTGGVYSVSGTVGQPDAGAAMSGGSYSLTGGFWALYAIQTPGAPRLSIVRVATNTVVIFWPSPSMGWNLHQNMDLRTTNWVAPVEIVTDDGTNRFITVSPPAGNRFYRLHKP